MRKAMKSCVTNMISEHENTMLILIDIGGFSFKELIEIYPKQIKNIGIFEPGTISIAAGLALTGITPTIYGISPFLVQRSLEQLKLDFSYQRLGGNFLTTGASYDFSELGYSHYCPEDVQILKTLPGIEILIPATPSQFKTLFLSCYLNGKPSYFRMTDYCNKTDVPVQFGKAAVLKKGTDATIVVFAEMLDIVLEACKDLNVTILYYTTAEPFDYATLHNNIENGKLFVCEPFYRGSFGVDILESVGGICTEIEEMGVPREILRSYGTKREKDERLGFSAENLRQRLSIFLRK